MTDWHQCFANWALLRHTSEVFKDFGTRALIEAKPQYGTKWRLLNISEAIQLFDVISSQVVHFPIGLLGFGAILTPNGHFEDWPPWRSDGLKSLGT